MARFSLARTLSVLALAALAFGTPSVAQAAKGGKSAAHRQDAQHRQDAAHKKVKSTVKSKKVSRSHAPAGEKGAAGGGVVQHK